MSFLNKLQTSVVSMDLVWKNLEQTRQKLEHENLNDYWLNPDGSCLSKKKWLHRLIRWIQNCLWNKTASDIWHLFRRTIEDQVHKETEKKSLEFVVSFLKSRKARLQGWFQENQKEFEFLESQLKNDKKEPWVLTACEEIYSCSHKLNLNMQAPISKIVSSETNKESNICKLAQMSMNTPWLNEHIEKSKNLKVLRDSINNGSHTNLSGVKEDKIPEYYQKINGYLNEVLSECENGKVSQEEVCGLLTTLSEPSPVNDLVRLENFCKTRKQLFEKRQEISVKELTLKDIHELKERVFLSLFKEQPYHLFNTFKLRYAKKLGLDDGIAQFDSSAQSYDEFSFSQKMTTLNQTLKEMKKSFLSAFEKTILSDMAEQIRERFKQGRDKDYIDFLEQGIRLKDKNCKDALGYVKANFLSDQKDGLNSAGVAFLLKEVGFLK